MIATVRGGLPKQPSFLDRRNLWLLDELAYTPLYCPIFCLLNEVHPFFMPLWKCHTEIIAERLDLSEPDIDNVSSCFELICDLLRRIDFEF